MDEGDVSLSERQKAMLLNDTSGVVQKSFKEYETTFSGKLPEVGNIVVYDSTISERILPISPPRTSQPISSIS